VSEAITDGRSGFALGSFRVSSARPGLDVLPGVAPCLAIPHEERIFGRVSESV
jgi:hypothetical protein